MDVPPGRLVAHTSPRRIRRVIFAVPFLTITDQTVDVPRGAIGSDRAVLERASQAVRRHTTRVSPARE
jgi:hypothetical protein